MKSTDAPGSVPRTFAVLRHLAGADGKGLRLKDIADAVDLPPPTTHRLLTSLPAEGMVERLPGTKLYRLALAPLALAPRPRPPMTPPEPSRPPAPPLPTHLR